MSDSPLPGRRPDVALLTGGGDRPYAHGLALSLAEQGIVLDFIGSDFLESPELRRHPNIRFLNLRGDARANAPLIEKTLRVLRYYGRLMRYAIKARPAIFHILWNNRLEYFDRTVLLLFYRLLGKKVVLTVHNVNAAERDGHDHRFNRATLAFQYRRLDHLFVHTMRMKQQLCDQFAVPQSHVSVIPFGINNTIAATALSSRDARARLGISPTDKCVLFFGNITPYKGLEHLVQAMAQARSELPGLRLIIAGRTKVSEAYWQTVGRQIDSLGVRDLVTERIEFIPDEDIETYFKAADVLALPYTHVFQSGVLFLGYNFGLPVIASDIASFREDIVEGQTGFVCTAADPMALAATLERFFDSDLFHSLHERRAQIHEFASERYSWRRVADITSAVYRTLPTPGGRNNAAHE